MKSQQDIRAATRITTQPRKGNVLVLAAGTLVLVFAFTAFTVDLGFITTSKVEMQKSADASALAAVLELQDAYGPGKVYTMSEAETQGRTAAQTVAGLNRSAGRLSTYVDTARDVRFGQYHYDDATSSWIKSWGVMPYNMVEVTVHRDQGGSANGDGPLDLFFAPVIGTQQANLALKSTAVLKPGVGFKKIPGYNLGVLPITLDVPTWDNLIQNGVGTDNYTYNANGTISSGPDGIKEVNLYPAGGVQLPPGNRGTVDFGGTNNSTSDLSRQIRYGLNDDDWEALADQGITELRWDGEEYIINGDTGLSAGIKDDLESIKGMPRAIPLFTEVSGPGNNAMYTIVRFVGIRIMNVKLTGSGKQVIIQPAPYNDGSVESGEVDLTTETILAPPSLVP
jgi:hypothetical protein